jgi:hypothetical protein
LQDYYSRFVDVEVLQMTHRVRAQAQSSHSTARQFSGPAAGRAAMGLQGLPSVLQMQSLIGNQAAIQMKPAKLDALFGAHMRGFTEDASSGKKVYKVNEKEKIGPKIKNNQEIEDLGTDDETGKWRMVEFGQKKGFIRKTKLQYGALSGLKSKLSEEKEQNNRKAFGEIGRAPEDDDDEGSLGVAGEVGEMLGTGPEGAKDSFDDLLDELKDKADKAGEKETLEHKSAVAGAMNAPMSIVNPVIEGLMGIKKIYKAQTDPQKDESERNFDTAEGVIDTASGINNFIGGMSGVVDDAGKLDGNELDKAGGVSDWSGSVGDAFNAVKSAFFAVKDIYDLMKKVFSDEGATLDEAVQGGAATIQHMLETAQSSVEAAKSIYDIIGKSAGNLSQAIPGLSIAVSGISITLKVYNMIKAYMSKKEMDGIEKESESQLRTKYPAFFDNGKLKKKALDDRYDELNGKRQNLNDKEKEELQAIEDYQLSSEMNAINRKRLVRGGIQIGLEMMNIAGDIATLSGAGATVGIPLKAVASGVGASMSIFRRIKQAGRDRAAKAEKEGKSSVFRTIFNAEKSTENKQAKRIRQANMILEMIAELPDYSQDEKTIKQYERVQKYITATGTSLHELFRLNGKLDKQRELLVKNMAARE